MTGACNDLRLLFTPPRPCILACLQQLMCPFDDAPLSYNSAPLLGALRCLAVPTSPHPPPLACHPLRRAWRSPIPTRPSNWLR